MQSTAEDRTGTWAPLEISADGAGADRLAGQLAETAGEEGLAALLTKEKGIVLRGFGITPDSLPDVLDLLLPNRLAYVHGNSPARRSAATSTPRPSTRPSSPSPCTTR